MSEQDTRKQLLNGICGSKSEKTPEIARQDGVLNISDVQDTREQLEADVRESYEAGMPIKAKVLDWLDRQAAITSAEWCWSNDALEEELTRKESEITELTEERDKLQRERNLAIGRAGYMERYAAEELAKLLGENDTIEVYDDKIHGKRRLVTGTQRKLEKQIAEMQAAIDAMGNGQFYAMYRKACEERDRFKDMVRKQSDSNH